MSDIGSEEFEDDEGINLGVSNFNERIILLTLKAKSTLYQQEP